MAGEVLSKADGIRAVSERIKKSVLRRYKGVPEPTVIPIEVPKAHATSDVKLPGNHPFKLVAVGRLEGEKRVQDLIEAMYRIPWKVGLVIVGDGRERSALEGLSQLEGQASRVTFMGSQPDARSLMSQADAFVQASAYEGNGLTLIEAALADVPIITTPVGIVGEVLDPETDVYTVPVADPPAIAAKVLELIKNRQEGILHAGRAKAHIEEHLAKVDSSPKAIIEDMTRLAI
jgi:glycosyltransferase involved in cell wall biosynthesis